MRRKTMIGALLTIAILLSGCWSRRELNDLSIAVAVGIDKDDDNYILSIQNVIPEAIASKKGDGSAPVTLVQEKGATVGETFIRMTSHSPRKIYLSHLQVLVISEKVAREGFQDVLDFFSRNRQIRDDFYIVISKNSSALDVLNLGSPMEKITARRLFKSLETSEEEFAPTTAVSFKELVIAFLSKGKEPTLNGVEITGDLSEKGNSMKNVQQILPATSIKVSQIAVLKKDKLIGWLNEEESKGYNYVANKVTRTAGFLQCPAGGTVGVNVLRSDTKVKGRIRRGTPEVDVKVYLEAEISEVRCRIDLTKPETMVELERIGEEKAKEIIEKAIHKVQNQYKSDVFGFGEAIHRADPKAWKKLEEEWDEHFAKLPVHVIVDLKILGAGPVGNSYFKK